MEYMDEYLEMEKKAVAQYTCSVSLLGHYRALHRQALPMTASCPACGKAHQESCINALMGKKRPQVMVGQAGPAAIAEADISTLVRLTRYQAR